MVLPPRSAALVIPESALVISEVSEVGINAATEITSSPDSTAIRVSGSYEMARSTRPSETSRAASAVFDGVAKLTLRPASS